MTTLLFANNAQTTLAYIVLPTDTTANLRAGTGSYFPQPSAGQGFYLTFQDAATNLLYEIVLVTDVTGDVITMVRGQQDTIAQTWKVGDLASQLYTAGDATVYLQDALGQVVTDVTASAPIVSSGGSTPNISMPEASSSSDGYLSSADWNTFNSKGSGTVTGVSGVFPVISSGGNTPQISMQVASATNSGYLTSTDWNTFNNKGVGTVTSVSVNSTNGFAGTSSGGTTPSLSLRTTVSGLLKGSNGAIVPAVSGVDYAPITVDSSLLSGNNAGGFTNVTLGNGLSFTSGVLSNTGVLAVTGTGSVNGITLSGSVTEAGYITLGGELTNVSLTSQVSGVLPYQSGGTNSTAVPTGGGIAYGTGDAYAFTGAGASGSYLNSNGDEPPTWIPFPTVVNYVNVEAPILNAGTANNVLLVMLKASSTHDGYLSHQDWTTFNNKASPTTGTSILYGNGSGGFSNVVIGSGITFSGGVLSATGGGGGGIASVSVATTNGFAGTSSGGTTPVLSLKTTVTGLLKGNGITGVVVPAVSGTDYAPATSGTSILYGNGAGGFSSVTIGSNMSFVGGVLSSTASGINGLGTVNYIPKFTATSAIGNSIIYATNTKIGIGTNNPTSVLTVAGDVSISDAITALGKIQSSNSFYVSGAGDTSTTIFGFPSSIVVQAEDQNQWGFAIKNTYAGDNYGLAGWVSNTGISGLKVGNGSGGSYDFVAYDAFNNKSIFYSSNNPVIQIISSGYVGIGGNTPTATLDVAGTVNLGATGTDTVKILGEMYLYNGVGSIGQVPVSKGVGFPPEWVTVGTGGGTVITVSVASANGFAGTSSGGANPELTLSTTISGLLKGNGTALQAATSGVDYAPATSGTSILYGDDAGGFNNVTIGSGVSFVDGTLSATGTGGTVTSVSATAPIYSTGGTDPVISITQASSTENGYLSSTDWSTFNGKQDLLVSTSNIKSVNGTSLLGSGNLSVGTVTSVGLTMPAAFSVTNSPIVSSGSIAVSANGTSSQYIRGDGQLADFPSNPSAGGAVNFYLNGGTAASVSGYHQMSSTAIIGTGVDFTASSDGYISEWLTDVGVPDQLQISAGNWNFEIYMSASATGGSPSFYVEVYKYNGGFTLIASNSTSPELITGGTSIDLYYSSVAIPQTTLLATDRIAVRVYVNTSGRTITMHTQDSHLCQIITNFPNGIAALNGLTANIQYFAVGTSGTDFAISSLSNTHTFNLPTSSAINRGALSSTDWTTFNSKQNALVSGVNIKTVNGNTLLGSGNLSVGTVTSVTATSPVVSTGGTTPVISMAAANGSTNGYLTSTDWTIFNNKAPATSGSSILYGNGSGGFSNVSIGTGLSFSGGTLNATGISGTTNYIPKFTSSSAIGDSLIYDDGSYVGINNAAPSYTLDVGGDIYASNQIYGAGQIYTDTQFAVSGNGSASVFGYPTLVDIVQSDNNPWGFTVRNATAGYDYGTNFYVDNSGNSYIGYGDGAGASGVWLEYSIVNNTSTFYSNGAPRLQINASGAFGLNGANYGTANQVIISNGSSAAPSYTSLKTVNGTSIIGTGNISVGTVTSVTGSSGRITSTGGATPVIDLANGIVTAGTTGSSTLIPVITVDTYGRVTSITTADNPQGTVTAVSVASANGFAGSSSGGATPQLTLTTTITGLLKGNGTAISAATSGVDYAPATSGTSILYGNNAGGFSNVTIGSGISFSGGTLSATGSGGTVTSVTATAPVVSSGGTTPVISMAAASSSVSGYLTSTDWTTFNNKGNINSVTGTAPVSVTSGDSPVISMAAANSTTNGYLSSTDWTTFNNKGSGSVTSVAALTLGTSGTDLNSTVANSTTTPVITLNVPTASASNRGALSSTDWTTFNSKQDALVNTSNIRSVNGNSLLGSGNVSVGTVTSVTGTAPVVSSGGTTPAISMAAASSTTDGYLTSTDWNTFNSKGSGTITGSGTTNYVSKFTSSTAIGSSVIYDDGTNVGIGTSNPQSILDLGAGVGRKINVYNDGTDALIGFGIDIGGGNYELSSYAGGTGTGKGKFTWQQYNRITNTYNEVMRIDSNGNVGIGVNSISSVGSQAVLAVGNSSGGTLAIYQSGSAVYRTSASSAGVDFYCPNASPLLFYTSATERLRIDSSGNVGIGTTSPAQKLDVAGAIKTTGGLLPRASSNANQTSPWAWSSASYDQQAITALANALTINADSGSPVDGQKTTFRIKDNGTGRALTWTTGSAKSFRAIGVTLPTTTVANKTVYIGCIYNAADSRWDVVSVAQEA